MIRGRYHQAMHTAIFVLFKLIFQSTGCDLQQNRPSEAKSRPGEEPVFGVTLPDPCGRTRPGLRPLLGRGSGSPRWRARWQALGPLQAAGTVPLLVAQVCPSSPGSSGSCSPGGGADPSPAPASLLLSPAPRPSLLWAPGTCPFPTSSCPLTCSDSHISLYLALLQISQKKKTTESQSLSQTPGPSGRTARPEHQLPWGPPPGLLSSPRLLTSLHPPASWAAAWEPLRCLPAMLFRPTCSRGSQAEVWTPAPPPASLLASPRSLPEPRSSCPADRNLCPRGAWGWRARDRQQTRSTSRGVGGDERWRTQRRGGADRKHGKRQRSGQR